MLPWLVLSLMTAIALPLRLVLSSDGSGLRSVCPKPDPIARTPPAQQATSEDISVLDVERSPIVSRFPERHIGDQEIALEDGRPLLDPPPRIDHRRDPRIRGSNRVHPSLGRAHRRHGQELVRSARAPVPGVVRDSEEDRPAVVSRNAAPDPGRAVHSRSEPPRWRRFPSGSGLDGHFERPRTLAGGHVALRDCRVATAPINRPSSPRSGTYSPKGTSWVLS